jgi:hypothetical protein
MVYPPANGTYTIEVVVRWLPVMPQATCPKPATR